MYIFFSVGLYLDGVTLFGCERNMLLMITFFSIKKKKQQLTFSKCMSKSIKTIASITK